jgi:hypothetical protein
MGDRRANTSLEADAVALCETFRARHDLAVELLALP